MEKEAKHYSEKHHYTQNNELLTESERMELLSEEVQEIMEHVPPWIIRWGVTFFLLVLLCIIFGSFIFKYPDVITAPVLIVSENPPIPIIAHVNGEIDSLLVINEAHVKKDEVLAIIENTANYHDVVKLKSRLNQLLPIFKSDTSVELARFSNDFSLGTIQSSFSNFHKLYQEYKNFSEINLIGKQILTLNKSIFDYTKYLKQLRVQAENHKRVVFLASQNFKRDSLLFSKDVISTIEYENSERNYLNEKNNYQRIVASITSSLMEINKLKYGVLELESQKIDELSRKFNVLKEAFENLQVKIDEWERQYLLTSPIEGKVAIINFWSENQYVLSGEAVFTVVPYKPQDIIGRVKVPIKGSGKVEVGQMVQIKLDNFPHEEFGMIEGFIESISPVPDKYDQQLFYTAKVRLNKGLVTNYNETLPFSQEMYGTAEIITRELTVFERLFNPIKASVKKSL